MPRQAGPQLKTTLCTQEMVPPPNDKDGLAETVDAAWCAFETELADKGKYPLGLFNRFFAAVKSYAEATTNHKMIHRKVASRVSGLWNHLSCAQRCSQLRAALARTVSCKTSLGG